MLNMENKNGIFNGIYMEEGTNQSKLNNAFLIQKTSNMNNNLNQYPNTVVYGHINQINYDINTDNDNVHAKDLRKYSQDNIMNDIIKNLNNQNQNILNYNFNAKKMNLQQKIPNRIAQKQKNLSFNSARPPLITKLSKENIFQANNEPVNQSIKSSDSFSTNSSQKLEENKKMMKIGPKISNEKIRNKSNYTSNEQNYFGNANDTGEAINQYNIKNNNNSNLLGRFYNYDNINGSLTGRNNEEIKINKIREEFKMIYDNRKYNYDKKVQKVNPNKIPVPQSKKFVEKILGLKEKKLENKNNYQDGKTSMYEINSQPLQKPNNIYNINNNNYELNQNSMINNNLENKNIVIISQNSSNDKFFINNNLNNNIKDDGNKSIISKETSNINNLNVNPFPQQFKNENQIYNDFNSQHVKIGKIQNNQNINQEHNMIKMQNQNQNQNIIQQQNQNYFIQGQNINTNINPLLNIQLPPPTKKNDVPQRNNMMPPKQQLINPAQQNQYISSQKQNQNQINNNFLKINPNIQNQNISVNQQNLNLQQKTNFFIEPSKQNNNLQHNQMANAINRQNIIPQQNTNIIQQQKENIIENRNENLNMISQKQNEFINYQNNVESVPLYNIIDNQIKENIPQNIFVQKIYQSNNIEQNLNINIPQQNVKIPQNNNLNIIQKPPIMNTPHKRNINIIKQPSNINSTKQNLNLAFQQPNLNMPQNQIQKQLNIIQNPQNRIQQQQPNFVQNQNLNLIQQQNANIHRNPNFPIYQEQNNIQNKSNINNMNNSENIRQNNNVNLINPQENKIQNRNNISNIPQYINISQQQNPQSIYNQNQNLQNTNLNMEKINKVESIESNENQIINNAYKQNIPQNQENIAMGQLQQIPDNTIIGNIIIKNGKAYYLNQNMNNINQENNNYAQPQTINIPQNQIQNQNIINSNGIIEGNVNIINNNQQIQTNYQNQIPLNNNPNLSQSGYNTNIQQKPQYLPQQPQQTNNSGQVLKSGKRVIKKNKESRASKLLKIKDSNDHRPALQYKVERNRPVYAVPPSKKRSVSQGKPFNLIHKYYDENYILEDDEEDSLKLEESINLQIAKNISDNEDNDK